MTCSFHKYGEFFPGTGDFRDVGVGQGKNYSVNVCPPPLLLLPLLLLPLTHTAKVPLNDGIDDEAYLSVFEPVIASIMEHFNPSAVVLQCGADSLSGDRLGCFNLSIEGHARAVRFVKSFGRHLLVQGGGGYTIRNVARCWAYETSVLLDTPVANQLPWNEVRFCFVPTPSPHTALTARSIWGTLDQTMSCTSSPPTWSIRTTPLTWLASASAFVRIFATCARGPRRLAMCARSRWWRSVRSARFSQRETRISASRPSSAIVCSQTRASWRLNPWIWGRSEWEKKPRVVCGALVARPPALCCALMEQGDSQLRGAVLKEGEVEVERMATVTFRSPWMLRHVVLTEQGLYLYASAASIAAAFLHSPPSSQL